MGATRGRKPGGRLGALVAGAAVAAAVAGLALGAADDVTLVSRTAGGAAADASSDPASSADGRLVAFTSQADDAAPGADDGVGNIVLRDLAAGTTVLVSRATGAMGTGADGESFAPAMSADGRVVAFSSEADNLSDAAADVTNAFARDLAAGTTALVSRATGVAGTGGDDASVAWAASADGRVVVFTSDADNLDPAANDGFTNVYARDLVAGTTTLVSRATGPAGAAADDASFGPSISDDGRLVAFDSRADNLSDADGGIRDIFVRDLVAGTTTLLTPPGADGDLNYPSISGDGSRIAFYSTADNLSDADDDAVADVFVRDLASGVTTLVSRAAGAAGAGGDGTSLFAAISRDGRRVAFLSDATNLSDADGDAVRDVFVRDLAASTTRLVSRASGATGAGADDDTNSFPAISREGRVVAFDSLADNLTADTNPFGFVYLREVPDDPAPPAPARPGAGPAPAPPRAAPAARCAGRRATIVGTARRDVIRGTARADVIAALGGNDLVRGLGGADLVCLGPGADRALGGPGADRILGGPGADRLLGGAGRDRLVGGPGRDRALGGPGRDACGAERGASC